MPIINFRILSENPQQINMPGNMHVLIRSQTQWLDPRHTVNGQITYSVANNQSNILFQGGLDTLTIPHIFNNHPEIIEDRLNFIRRGNNAHPSNQFDITVSVGIEHSILTSVISVIII